MKWKCANGQELEITELSDDHLENALEMSVKQRKGGQIILLDSEKKRRAKKRYYAQTRDCPFCSGVMRPIESFPDPEVGWQSPTYRFNCEQCGAASNEIKGP